VRHYRLRRSSYLVSPAGKRIASLTERCHRTRTHAALKAKIALEAIREQATVAELAKRYKFARTIFTPGRSSCFRRQCRRLTRTGAFPPISDFCFPFASPLDRVSPCDACAPYKIIIYQLVLRERIELSTSPLPRECSTTELPQLSPKRFENSEARAYVA
jgi:hypothetical protein